MSTDKYVPSDEQVRDEWISAMTTDDTTPEQYTPSDGELQELIVGLLLDAGDYVRHGQPDPGETLTWDQREVRAWRSARLLSERHAHDARVRRDAAREALIEFRRTELALIPSDADEDDPIRTRQQALAWRIEMHLLGKHPEESP